MTAHTFESLISCDLYFSFSSWNLLMPVSHEIMVEASRFLWMAINLFIQGCAWRAEYTVHLLKAAPDSHYTANAWDTKGSSMCSSLRSDSSWDRENEWIYNSWHTDSTVNLRKPLKSSLVISRDSCSHASSHRRLAINWQELQIGYNERLT